MDKTTCASRGPYWSCSTSQVGFIIASEVGLVREGLRAMLEAQMNLPAIAYAKDASEVLAHLWRQPTAHIVLMDAGLKQCLYLVRSLHAIDPQIHCVPFGVHDTPEAAERWQAAGATAILHRGASSAELFRTIGQSLFARNSARHEFADIAPKQMEEKLPASALVKVCPPLTARERQILAAINDGRSNKEIARQLRIEPATVKCHVHNLLTKLHVRRRAEAAVWLRLRMVREI